jgi:phosphoglycerate dehydrogenase-like enzyme
MERIRTEKRWIERMPMPGAYGSTVGLVSLGMIGRRTLDLLRPFDVKIVVYSTSLTEERAGALNVRRCDLDELFSVSDVVSLHTPNIPETQGMIRGKHFRRMQNNATFINTARGAVVNEPEMIEVLKERKDLTAVLDVTNPEPPVAGSPLYELPNVVLTPHIAGSMFNECRRMGQYAVDECRRYLDGRPLQWQITRVMAQRLA